MFVLAACGGDSSVAVGSKSDESDSLVQSSETESSGGTKATSSSSEKASAKSSSSAKKDGKSSSSGKEDVKGSSSSKKASAESSSSEKTKDGFDLVMGTNYLGVYRLGEKLLPRFLECGHEVVYINTISIIHKIAKVDLRHFNDSRGAYARSKLCLARYTHALAEKYAGTNIRIVMSHPGIAITSIARHVFGPLYLLAEIAPFNSVEKSSLTAAWILSHLWENTKQNETTHEREHV